MLPRKRARSGSTKSAEPVITLMFSDHFLGAGEFSSTKGWDPAVAENHVLQLAVDALFLVFRRPGVDEDGSQQKLEHRLARAAV